MNSYDPITLYELSRMHHAQLLGKTQAGRLLRTRPTHRRVSVGWQSQGWTPVWALVITLFTRRKPVVGTAVDKVKLG